ncbi:hypothetical protein CDL15_Pgr021138 [Punica granatum]|uniref:Uncharacterized protein n=1 Tax=Punica granatum TaxID=22663 RepID=A0A218WLD0_PUNGR|nr:hypothetical protein CDL15_Pgr021138 [Punica granatum]
MHGGESSGFDSFNFGQSGRFYLGGPFRTHPAQLSRGQWRPTQSAQHSSSQSPTGHLAGQAQAHCEQTADLSKLANLSKVQLQQLVSMVSRDDGEVYRLSGENFMPITSQLDWIIDSGAS